MIRKPPYYFWLLLSLLCGAGAAVLSFVITQKEQPKRIVAGLEAAWQRQQRHFHQLLANKDLTRQLLQNNLSPEAEKKLLDAPYFIYTGQPGQLTFWNTDRLADTSLLSAALPPGRAVFFRQLPFVGIAERRQLNAQQSVTAFFPLAVIYPFENNFLQSHLANGLPLSPGMAVSEKPAAGAMALHDADGRTLAYITLPRAPHAQPAAAGIILAAAALLFLVLWLQLLALWLARRKKAVKGFLLIAGAGLLLRAAAFWPGLPLQLSDLPLFSPQLYSTNMLLPSLGDLLLHALLFLWLCWFGATRLTFRHWQARQPVRWLAAIAVAGLTVVCYFSAAGVLKSLVLNSSGISFSADALRHVSWLSMLGIGIAACITLSFCLLLFFCIRALGDLLGNAWVKYLLLPGMAALAAWLFPALTAALPLPVSLLWLVLALLVLDAGQKQLAHGPAELPLVMTGLFLAASATPLLHYFNHQKSIVLMQLFAERVATESDNRLEWYFPTLALRLQQDENMVRFLEQPSAESRQLLNRQINAYYLTSWLSNYSANLLVFDENGLPLYNDNDQGMAYYEKELDNAVATADAGLYFRGGKGSQNTYLARLEIYKGGQSTGFLFLELSRKKAINERVLPDLFLPARLLSNPAEQSFAFAIYEDNRIVTRSSDFPFPYYLQQGSGSLLWQQQRNGLELLRYVADNGRTVLVLQQSHGLLDVVLFFSFVFALLALLALLLGAGTLWTNWLAGAHPVLHLSLRRRVQLAMLLLVFVSFVLIGLATTSLVAAYYRQNTRNQRLATLELISNRIEQYLHEQRKPADPPPASDPEFKYILARQAYNHNVDIHIYDSLGRLLYTTRDELFNNGLLSPLLRPDVLHHPWPMMSPAYVADEQIGGLKFTSSYLPLTNPQGQPAYYLNVPFFSSAKELNAQISYVVVALINLYILALLLSGLLTVPLTNWLSRSLEKIIRHLERTDVRGNEPLQWPHDDEIGRLVREYNKMVKKVEASAAMLARSERETAWREVARQVAHEIKNPLTPMKLNIQYLQQAITQNRPDALTLARRLSASLIEQIDHLAHIAGSFSAFAAMPEPQPERLHLNSFLKRAATLHQEASRITVTLQLPPQDTFVWADRNHLLSILTNLIQNAAQAMPEEKAGGRIVLGLTEEAGKALITVADNGRGIPDEVQEKIFTPYFTTKSSGTGLGLAMTRRLVEGAGGRIWFESKAGEGTTFFIALPVLPAQEPNPALPGNEMP